MEIGKERNKVIRNRLVKQFLITLSFVLYLSSPFGVLRSITEPSITLLESRYLIIKNLFLCILCWLSSCSYIGYKLKKLLSLRYLMFYLQI